MVTLTHAEIVADMYQGYSHHHLNIFSKVQKKIQISLLEIIWLLLWGVHFFQQLLEIYSLWDLHQGFQTYTSHFTQSFISCFMHIHTERYILYYLFPSLLSMPQVIWKCGGCLEPFLGLAHLCVCWPNLLLKCVKGANSLSSHFSSCIKHINLCLLFSDHLQSSLNQLLCAGIAPPHACLN